MVDFLKFQFNKRNDNISFIFGSARGGTTWLWSLLESHPDVKPFIDGVQKDERGLYKTSESGIYIKNKKTAKKIISNFIRRNRKSLVVEKTPSHTFLWKEIIEDFPNSKNIILLRNPIAVVNSMYRSEMDAFKNHDLEKSIKTVKSYYKKLIELVYLETYCVIKYEDLLENTFNNLNAIYEYLNLNCSFTNQIILENKANSKVDIKGVFRKGQLDSFSKEFTKDEIQFLKKELSEELKFFNNQKSLVE